MPKMKTKSSLKMRFSRTKGGKGKLKRGFAAKRHGMTKRNPRMIRNARGTTDVAKADVKRLEAFAPYL